jgi:hypothetical protein
MTKSGTLNARLGILLDIKKVCAAQMVVAFLHSGPILTSTTELRGLSGANSSEP